MWQSSQAMWQLPVTRFGSTVSAESSVAIEDRKHSHMGSSSGLESSSSPLRLSARSARLRGDRIDGRHDSSLNDIYPSPQSRQFSRIELENVVEESVNRCISQLGLLDMQEKVLQTVSRLNFERPDFSPIVTAINEIAQHASHGNDSQAAVIEALSNVKVDMPAPDLGAMEQILQEVRNEVQRTGEDIRRDVAACCDTLRQEVINMRSEAAENYKESRTDSEIIIGDVRNLPQALSSHLEEVLAKSLGRGHDREEQLEEMLHKVGSFSEVLRTLDNIDKRLGETPDIDVQNVCDAVFDRIVGTRIELDSQDAKRAQKTSELDHDALCSVLIDKMKKVTWTVDNTEVFRRFDSLPDKNAIATAVHGKINQSSLKIDFSELLCAIENIDSRLDFTPLLNAIQSAELDFTPILNAISNVKIDAVDSEHLASIVHSRLCSSVFQVDHSEVLQALSDYRLDINTRAPAEALQGTVFDARTQRFVVTDSKPVLDDIDTRNVTIETDLKPVLEVLNALKDMIESNAKPIVEANGNREVLQAIKDLNIDLDFTPILEAIGNKEILQAIRDVKVQCCSNPVAEANNTRELLQAIKDMKVDVVDNTEILQAIKELKVDLGSRPILATTDKNEILKAIKDIKIETDLKPVLEAADSRKILQAIKDIKVESDLRVMSGATDNSEVLKAIRDIKVEVDLQPILEAVKNAAIDLRPLHEAICKRELEVAPLWEAVSRIKLPDAEIFASSVIEKLRSTEGLLQPDAQAVGKIVAEKLQWEQWTSSCVDNTEVLEAIQKLAMDLENSAVLKDVLKALNATQADLGAAITKVCGIMSPTPMFEAIRGVSSLDSQVFADAVYERIHDKGLQKVIEEIRGIRIPPADLTPLIRAINDAEVDLSPATDAVNKVASVVNTMRNEMKQLLKGVHVSEGEATETRFQTVVTHPPVLTDPVRTLPFSVEVVQNSMQATAGSTPRIPSPFPGNRAASAVTAMAPTHGNTQRTPSPLMTSRLQKSSHASQRPVELIGADVHAQVPPRSVSRQRSLEVIPGRSVEASFDFPAPRLLEQHNVHSGVLTVPPPRTTSPLRPSLTSSYLAPAPVTTFTQLRPLLTETTTTVTETVVGDASAEAAPANMTLSPLSTNRSSSVHRASSASRMPKRNDGRSSDPYSTSDSLRTFSFQD